MLVDFYATSSAYLAVGKQLCLPVVFSLVWGTACSVSIQPSVCVETLVSTFIPSALCPCALFSFQISGLPSPFPSVATLPEREKSLTFQCGFWETFAYYLVLLHPRGAWQEKCSSLPLYASTFPKFSHLCGSLFPSSLPWLVHYIETSCKGPTMGGKVSDISALTFS